MTDIDKEKMQDEIQKLKARLAILEAQPDEGEEMRKEEIEHEKFMKEHPENKDDYFWRGAYKKILVQSFE